MVHVNNPTNSEVDAYTYIKIELDKLGWNVKNPARNVGGEVYKQNEVLSHTELKKCLDRDMPEAVVKLNENDLWVIESKRDKKDIDKAVEEAIEQYAKKINKSNKIRCVIASGVAGNDTDGFIVCNKYYKSGKWQEILFNDKTKNILLSKLQAKYILENDTIKWMEFPDIPEEKYISAAVSINETLHNAGVNKNKRAKFIAGLILSLSVGQDISLRTEDTSLLVENVNNLIKAKLREVKKENFYEFLKLELPPSAENHTKYRTAIIETIKELHTLDIKNAMASGKDVLGEFYEKFLKYGNGAKEIGIVLTPRHITEFAVNVLNITYQDYIFDPTCGTGGFLVSAYDKVRSNTLNQQQLDKFKTNNIFGIEQDDEVVALALVNMIFRGDGRNNMSEGNCFQKKIKKISKNDAITGKFVKNDPSQISSNDQIITKVLMNPPFALKKGDEKERHFISYALQQMVEGGLLFAIVPISVMVEGNQGKDWRKELLRNNSILAIITLPEDLFYPVSMGTVGVFVKKGIPHNFDNQKVYFARAIYDGHKKKKGKRVRDEKEPNYLKKIETELNAFLINQEIKVTNVPEFKKVCKLDANDLHYEIVPEAYIDTKVPTEKEIEVGIEQMIRDAVGYLIKSSRI